MLSGSLQIEFFIAAIAIIFFIIGVYLNKKSLQKSSLQKHEAIDHAKIEQLGLSRREYEILIEIANGLSNKEIGEKLFLSESTVKTHVSNLFVKLDVKRRTQAIQIAKEMDIIL